MSKKTPELKPVSVSTEVAEMLEQVTESRGGVQERTNAFAIRQIKFTQMVESGGWELLWKWFNAETERLRRQYFDIDPAGTPENNTKREGINAEIHYRQKVQDHINTYVQNSLARRKQ